MGLMNSLMLSCRKATELMERASMQPLPAGDRMRLWMHLKVCDGCRAFEKQGQVIDQLITQRKVNATDSAALEERILQAIDEKGSTS
jgi:hypothetical protein